MNQFVATTDGSFVGQVKSVVQGVATLCTIKDYLQPRNAVWGVHARNMEQSLALNLLMNPDIDFVTLLGQAGTGKTLITLAAALAQTLEDRRFSEIIFTRATVSVGEEIGFLPGTEEEKMTPWMGALEDNLEVLNKADRGAGSWGRSAAADIIRSRIRIKSMSFMRGRTFLNKFVIIDEAQFLTKAQVKMLVEMVDDYDVPVIAYGLRADFQNNFFEGSQWLMACADTIEEIKTICWCGRKATCNARVVDGRVVQEGEQVVLGGNGQYVSLCRKHFRRGELGDFKDLHLGED